MNVHFPAQRRWASRLAHLAVVIVVLALAAATFVLSYTGVHSIALQAGVPTDAARIYPGIFDAALVIACAAALMLREGRWWARTYAWLSIILVIAVVGAADAVHAMNVALPLRKTAGVVAAAPWVLVLLGFSLWLTMLRQSRTQRTGQPLQPTALEPTALEPVALEPVAPEREPAAAAEREPAPSAETPAEEAARTPEPVGEARGETSPDEGQSLPGQTTDSESADEARTLPRDYWDTGNAGGPGPQPTVAPPALRGRRTPAASDEEEPPLPFATVPRLRRVRSTPTPPEDGDEGQ
ncbi:MAG TPA: DUF2637 domain-containing protein [Trebonia sp.]